MGLSAARRSSNGGIGVDTTLLSRETVLEALTVIWRTRKMTNIISIMVYSKPMLLPPNLRKMVLSLTLTRTLSSVTIVEGTCKYPMDIQKLRRILEDRYLNRRGLRYNFFRALEFQPNTEEADANCVSEQTDD